MKHFVPSKEHMLQLDLDTSRDMELFVRHLREFHTMGHYSVTMATLWPSRENWHANVFLDRSLDVTERIALQSILGSDRLRELRNWGRVRNGAPHPILFIEEDK